MSRREFDAAGVAWRVFDVTPSQDAEVSVGRRRGWLCFESPHERRRLSPIPIGWSCATGARLVKWLDAAIAIERSPFAPERKR